MAAVCQQQFGYGQNASAGMLDLGGVILSAGETVTVTSTSGFVRFGYTTGGMYNYSFHASPYTFTAPTNGPFDLITYNVDAANALTWSGTAGMSCTYLVPQPAISGVSPSNGLISGGTSVTISGTGFTNASAVTFGVSPASYTVVSDTVITATAPAHAAGQVDVSVTTPGGSNTSNHAFTYVAPPAVTYAFSPAAGALPQAMVGEEYSQTISASGGSGNLTYHIASGSLPQGLSLNPSTGEIAGRVDASVAPGTFAFTVEVADGNASTGTASYTLLLAPRAVSVTNQSVSVPVGSTPPNINLGRGATGGPFNSAEVTFVEPPSAGRVEIVRGEFASVAPVAPTGWYLKFTPNKDYNGQARVGFRLTSVLGVSNTGVVTYTLMADAAKVASETDFLVRNFVRTRQNLIASTIRVPGLLERRQIMSSTEPVTLDLSPSGQGLTAHVSTSLSQMNAAASQGEAGAEPQPFNVWVDATFLAHNDKDVNGSRWGSFGLFSLGADYLVSDKALVGLSFHYDHMTDPTDADAELKGNGWLAGPYASLEIGKGVFWNASILYGGSDNSFDGRFWDGDFTSKRWLADTSIVGQWMLDQDTVLTPKLRALYFSETVDDYSIHDANANRIGIKGFDQEQLRISLGAEIARNFTLENEATLTPKVGVTGGYSALDGSGSFASVSAGLSLQASNMWTLDSAILFNVEGDGGKSAGARIGARRAF